MFKFPKEQAVFEISGVKIGGQPGELPTAMVGSMFYHGHKIVSDEKEGVFDKKKAEDILNKHEEIMEKTGNPGIIDVVGAFPNAIIKYIDYIADKTQQPMLIDGTTSKVRIAALQHLKEVGLADRAIYNSIIPEIKDEEKTALTESGIKSSILLTYNPKKPTLAGRMEVLRGPEGLVNIAKEIGIEKPLVDATILGVADPGPVAKAIYLVKEEFGLPGGCGAHNAVDRWHKSKKLDKQTYLVSSVVANITSIIMGANFMLYGPLGKAEEMFPPFALADAYVAYSMRQEYGIKPLTRNHPLFKIF